jgi:NitT/TauT family transport system permease protein
MVIGFSIAAAAGLFIGLLMGMSRVVNSCLRSLFLAVQTLPTAAWVPVSLLIYGLSDRGIYWRILVRWGLAQKA